MEFLKTIIQGRLEFGNPNSYQKVLKMYIYRAENYYKLDVIFKEADEIFNEEDLSLAVPRFVGKASEKSWKNTVSLLDYCSQFALSGQFGAWQTDTGKIINYAFIEPQSDKAAVTHFKKGKELSDEKGKEQEAIDALTKAIEKYNHHAQAYERRAWVNVLLKRNHDAMRDYNKAINIDSTLPYAYYGRAKLHILKEDYDNAILDLLDTIKTSIALQSIYWKGRRVKSECHIKLGQFTEAAFDLKLFNGRDFSKDASNERWRRYTFFSYGKVLMQLENYVEAIKSFDTALSLEENYGKASDADILYERGIAKAKIGKSGHIKDLKQAADLGNKKAVRKLKEIS